MEFPHYSVFAITQGEETVLIGVVDTHTTPCGSKSNINLLEFLWGNTMIFSFLKYGIICVYIASLTILYLRHHMAGSGGWAKNSLCRPCVLNYRPVFDDFIPECSDSTSCRCHVCVRQHPSPRSLASYAVFHKTNNLSEFTLSSETLYHHYVRAVKSKFVPTEILIPNTFHLRCTFARAWTPLVLSGITKPV